MPRVTTIPHTWYQAWWCPAGMTPLFPPYHVRNSSAAVSPQAAPAAVQVACVSQPHVRFQHRSQTPTMQDMYLNQTEAQACVMTSHSCTADWSVPAMPRSRSLVLLANTTTAPRSKEPFSLDNQGSMTQAQSPLPRMCDVNLLCQPAVSILTYIIVKTHIKSIKVINKLV